jgi:RNA polymerase sigma factor (sigma-70 family)
MIGERQVTECYARASAARFRVPRDAFAAALEAGAARAFAGRAPGAAVLDTYLATLHLEDLALACACVAGDEEAWDCFLRTHRPLLYRTADMLDPSGGARDLADSLYGELFGLEAADGVRRSLFRYFHGRSSLATWLRAVLSQRHVDRFRERRRNEPLDEGNGPMARPSPPPDPPRDRLIAAMRAALTRALIALAPNDRLRLSCYYARQMTLARVGLLLGEHEATVSRQLARARASIRRSVETELRTAHRMTDELIADCFRALADDPGPLDLGVLLGRKEFDLPRSKDTSRDDA